MARRHRRESSFAGLPRDREAEARASDVLKLVRLWRYDADDVAEVYGALREDSANLGAVAEFMTVDHSGRTYARALLRWVKSGDYVRTPPPVCLNLDSARDVAGVVEDATGLEGIVDSVVQELGEDETSWTNAGRGHISEFDEDDFHFHSEDHSC